jgi:uncharacterized phage-associated protein
MTKLESTIIYLLSKAQERGKGDLSKFELFKLIYLLETESYRFTGGSFFGSSISFVRDKNGPISVEVYNALGALKDNYITIMERKNEEYSHSRHCISLKKKVSKLALGDSEKMFINSIINSYGNLTIKHLKKIFYDTEPMEEILTEEKKNGGVSKGAKIDFNCIRLDENLVDLIVN